MFKSSVGLNRAYSANNEPLIEKGNTEKFILDVYVLFETYCSTFSLSFFLSIIHRRGTGVFRVLFRKAQVTDMLLHACV